MSGSIGSDELRAPINGLVIRGKCEAVGQWCEFETENMAPSFAIVRQMIAAHANDSTNTRVRFHLAQNMKYGWTHNTAHAVGMSPEIAANAPSVHRSSDVTRAVEVVKTSVHVFIKFSCGEMGVGPGKTGGIIAIEILVQ